MSFEEKNFFVQISWKNLYSEWWYRVLLNPGLGLNNEATQREVLLQFACGLAELCLLELLNWV